MLALCVLITTRQKQMSILVHFCRYLRGNTSKIIGDKELVLIFSFGGEPSFTRIDTVYPFVRIRLWGDYYRGGEHFLRRVLPAGVGDEIRKKSKKPHHHHAK